MLKQDFIKVRPDLAAHEKMNVFREAVIAERPELRAAEFYFCRTYQNVLMTEGEVHKRGNKLDGAVANGALAMEMQVQDFLWRQGMPVPEITYAGQQTNFYSMTQLPDMTFSDAYFSMTETQRRQAARDIGAFLATVPQKSLAATFNKSALKKSAFDLVLADEIAAMRGSRIVQVMLREYPVLAGVIDEYIAELPQRPNMILHGDFFQHLGNACIEKENMRFSGAIDFGEACLSKVPEAELNSVINQHFAEDKGMAQALKEGYFAAYPAAEKGFACLSFIKAAAYAATELTAPVAQVMFIEKVALRETRQALQRVYPDMSL